jgi:hypothetical protein
MKNTFYKGLWFLKGTYMCCDTIVGCMSGDRFAQTAEKEMMKGNFTNATLIWADMEDAVLGLTDNVVFRISYFLDYFCLFSASQHHDRVFLFLLDM